MKRAPFYWWDFKHYKDGRMTIIIETDDHRIPTGIVEEIPDTKDMCDKADAIVKELREGRRRY